MAAHARAHVARTSGFDRRWLALGVTTIGSFMSILDSTIVNVALPSVLRDFNAGLARGQLVLTVYLLALAVVIPLSGFLADRIGIKRLYMVTLVFFTAGSALCGLAWNLPSLIGFRALQGLGGGMLQPLGMALVFTMITPMERGYFMGLLGLPMLLAPLLGPTLGGYLSEYVSWRMIFLINLPIGVINFVLAWVLLKERPRRTEARF
ncbi:MAG: MFS transporter, partial [Dehalococcoidia bacterium]